MNIDIAYAGRNFRRAMGFSSQESLKNFYKASDIARPIDIEYISKLNERLVQIVKKVNDIVHVSVRQDNIKNFLLKNLEEPFSQILANNLLPRMTNQGRKPEDVYFSWMKGHLFSEYFKNSLSLIFNINKEGIKNIGDDDFHSLETFRRSPTADLEIEFDGAALRIEMQNGFMNVNDIKHHKWMEAKRKLADGIRTIVMHIDLFNGVVAFVRLDNIEQGDLNWITRTQMEGQLVYNIDASQFSWLLVEEPPRFTNLNSLTQG